MMISSANRLLTRRSILRGGTLAAIAAMTKACGKIAGGTINIGFQNYGSIYLAHLRGEFEKRLAKRGVGSIRWREFQGGTVLAEAIKAGAVDFGYVGDAPLAMALAADVPLNYVAGQRLPKRMIRLLVHADSPIRSVADLRGRRLAIQPGTAAHLTVVDMLSDAGMKLADIRPTYLNTTEIMPAFIGKSVDAWISGEPYLSIIESRVPSRTIDIPQGKPSIYYYVASRKLVESQPQALSALLDELYEESLWGDAHFEQVVSMAASDSGVDEDAQRRFCETFMKGPDQVVPISADVVDNQQSVIDRLFGAGIIDRQPRAQDGAWTGWSRA